MKINFISISTKIFLLITLISCESREQKSNEAFDQFKEEKMMSKDCVLTNLDTFQQTKTLLPLKINESLDEWKNFKNEIENKILLNENKIKKLKQTPDADIKLFKKIVRLEKDNDDLKKQLSEYEKEVKENLEKFKEKVEVELSDIGVQLKDISINKKNK
jgi:uncharacterized protein YlzI (FlbEa/FlbD family)